MAELGKLVRMIVLHKKRGWRFAGDERSEDQDGEVEGERETWPVACTV